MNFNQWWNLHKNSISKISYDQEVEDFSRSAWNECKRQMLNILNSDLIENMNEIEVAKLFKRIERL
jgi:hypothetical protein